MTVFKAVLAQKWLLFMVLLAAMGVSRGAVAGPMQPVQSIRCLSAVFEPFVIERNGEISGIDVDVVREVGRRLNIQIEIALKPWIRLESEIEMGEEVCAFSYFRTDKRLDYMDYTNVPLHITNYSLFTQDDPTLDYRGLEDIPGFTVGVNRGFETPESFKQAVAEGLINEVRVEQDSQSFRMLSTDRLDAVLTNSIVGAYQIKNLGYPNMTALFPPLSSTPAYLTFSKKAGLTPLVPLFDSALYDILMDGTYQQIFDQYTKVSP